MQLRSMYEKNTKYIDLKNTVQHLINCGVSAHHKPLINAFFESSNWDFYDIIYKILDYGIDINSTFIKAIEKGNIGVIIRLMDLEVDQQLLSKVSDLAHESDKKNNDDLLKKFLKELFEEKYDPLRLKTKYLSFYRNLSTDWAKSTANRLRKEFPLY